MSRFLNSIFLALCAAFLAPLSAQTIGITYQTPDGLLVCGTDTLRLTVQNNTGAALPTVQLTLDLPSGMEYVPGSANGATEIAIGNLAEPVLALSASLPPGAQATVAVLVRATCAMVEAINSNQLFFIGIQAQQGTLTSAVSTTTFAVETPYVVITDVQNDSLAGELGDVLTRTIRVRNTRLGALAQLFFTDAHNAGMTAHVPGAAAENNTATLFTATFDGSFFAAFGDGDALFEFNEEIVIVEEVTITDCGTPEYFIESVLSASWNCAAGNPVCQDDIDFAEIFVRTSTKEPAVAFYPSYGLPWNYCAGEASPMKVLMVNVGNLPAENILLVFTSVNAENLGLDPNSFRLRAGGVTTPVPVSIADSVAIDACVQPGSDLAAKIGLTIPVLAPGDTVELIFDVYFCAEHCNARLDPVQFDYFYSKPCPPSQPFNNGTQFIAPNAINNLASIVRYTIGDCLVDGQVYDFNYELESNRLLTDTGFVWFKLDLPWGLFWEDCGPLGIAGQTPAHFSVDTLVTYDTITRVLLAFQLPLDTSRVALPFCLRATCRDDASYTQVSTSSAPDPGGNFQVFTPECTPCGYKLEAEILLTHSAEPVGFDCAVAVCSPSELHTECECPFDTGPGGGSGNPNGSGCYELRHHYRAARVNFGLADADNDRHADGAAAADPAVVRRDRFMPGDTLDAVMATRILCGDSINFLSYQFFVETAESDIPHAGVNDFFEIRSGRGQLTDADRFRAIEALVSIWDSSTNTMYTCTMDPVVPYDSLYGIVTPVNVEPQAIIDRLITMNHVVNPVMDSLALTGCVPPGFRLEAGDSVEVRLRYKLDFNFAPFSQPNWPPLINFEVGFNPTFAQSLHYNYRVHDTLMFQYSGFRDTLTSNLFGIRPCQPSTEIRPFLYGIRLARENLFPFEVRPLSRLSQYDITLPNEPVNPVSATLKYVRLQENVPWLPTQPLGFNVSNNRLFLDFSPVYAEPLDEGYKFETAIEFDPSCAFTRPDSSRQTAVFEYYNCLRMPNPDTVSWLNTLGYLANRARDTLTTNELLLEFPTAAVSADVQLKNLSPIAAPNYWIRLANPEGGLTGYSIAQLPGNTAVPATNGIFQLGNLPGNAIRDLRISATNTTCDPQTLRIIYGWHCSPYTDAAMTPCEDDTLDILVIPLLPELELELVQFPASVPLCDTSGYIVLELSNADIGYAYTPYLDLQLPANFAFVPGSFQLSYPAGSPYVPISDPAPLGADTYFWQIEALVPAIAAGGLPGVNLDPQNTVRVRFRVVPTCGAVSNAQIIFGTTAKNSCNENTNALRKASPPLLIEGFAPAYGVQLAVAGAATPAGCDQEIELTFNAQVQGTPVGGDSLYIALPAGFSYVANSYVPGTNAPPGGLAVAGSDLRLALPAGLAPNSVLSFTLRVRTPSTPLCQGAALVVQTRQQTAAFCPLTGANCNIYVATGEAFFNFPAAQPALTVNSAGISVAPDGTVSVSADFSNTGAVQVPLSVVEWYRDVDGSGTLTPADTVVFAVAANQVIAPGGLGVLLETGLPNPGNVCGLLLVVPTTGNCLCAPAVFPLPAGLQTATFLTACAGVPFTVGVTAMPGFTYAWNPAAPCTGCSSFDTIPAAPGTYAFSLTEQGAGCTVVHQFTITQFQNPLLLSADTTICRGESVTLATAGGQAWQWSPTGGTPGPTLTVQPAVTTTYAVTITSAQACTAAGSVTVTVLDSSYTDLGVLRTCEGTPVPVFGSPTETPGTYCQTLTNANGCDSTVCLVLEVLPGTSEAVQKCAGDPVVVFGDPVTAPGTYCQAFPSSLGCDSVHCVVVTDFPPVALPFADTAIAVTPGVPVTLSGPPGFAAYSWAPPTGLSCTACQSPVATPADTTVYTVTVITAHGCRDSIRYRLLPTPPCDAARVEIPNAFTPNGDGYNDRFQPVVTEPFAVSFHLTIWDRWGEKIYEASGPNVAWDGTYNGKTVPPDVYVWILYVDCGGELTEKRGDVTVLR